MAVDTEFMRESTYWPKLCLVQAAAEGVEAVIDPLAPEIDLEPFLAIMRDEAIEKVFHAARQDVEILSNLGIMPVPCSTPKWRRWRRLFPSRSPTTPGAADAQESTSINPAVSRTGRAGR